MTCFILQDKDAEQEKEPERTEMKRQEKEGQRSDKNNTDKEGKAPSWNSNRLSA